MSALVGSDTYINSLKENHATKCLLY